VEFTQISVFLADDKPAKMCTQAYFFKLEVGTKPNRHAYHCG